jgi:hypothetical protein
MIDKNTFFKLWNQLRGINQDDLTSALKSLVNSNQGSTDNLFRNIIDQPAFNTADYQRLRQFLIDWYASLRTMTGSQTQVTDPFSRSNDELDELFRSFGYNFSTDIKGPSVDPVSLKVAFFLDLVNLYKIKGTPQALLEVLQYYGINEVDIYELWVRKESPSSLIFRGNIVAGTSGKPEDTITLPFDLLTENDPHWRYSQSQILTLDKLNKINLPSLSPYFAVKPIYDVDAASLAILFRTVHDQFDIWNGGGTLTEDAAISLLGEDASLLALYLACIYFFNQAFSAGFNSGNNYVIYDGTNTTVSSILDEFDYITQRKITERSQILERLNQYYDTFTRIDSTHFLQNPNDAGNYLALVDSTLKNDLDSLGEPPAVILESLLKDLGDWVKVNINFGFINIALILGGLTSVFADLRGAINFFKPYRARLIPIESIQARNRLFGTIFVEDSFSHDVEQRFYDFITGDGAPCCSGDGTTVICYDSTDSPQYYARDTYDCGSYHDIGAATDLPRPPEFTIEHTIDDYLKCPTDGTGFVVSDLLTRRFIGTNTVHLEKDEDSIGVSITDQTNTLYVANVDIYNIEDPSPSIYDYVITGKNSGSFNVTFSDFIDSENYLLDYKVDKSTSSGILNLSTGDLVRSVLFPAPTADTNYAITGSMVNTVDANPSIFRYSVIEKYTTGFKVQFSAPIDSDNYSFEWIAYDSTASGITDIANGSNYQTVNLPIAQPNNDYAVIVDITNTVDGTSSSIYSYIVKNKTSTSFDVVFSSPIDSPNYKLNWYVISQTLEFNSYEFYQSGEFRDFDTEGTFDCTFGFDLVKVQLLPAGFFILKEDGGYLLQENGGRLLLEESP